jgi:hypothetical protein
MFNLNQALDTYVNELAKSLIVVDLMVVRVKSKRMTDRINKLLCDIEARIEHDQVVVDNMFAKNQECPMTSLVCRRTDDTEEIYNVPVFDLTNNYEHEYAYIKPDDIWTNKKQYYEKHFDYEYVYEAEHDPDKLLESGWQPILGIAYEYEYDDKGKPDAIGVFYKTHANGGVYEDYHSCETYTWYCDGIKCWLRQAPIIDDGKEHRFTPETHVSSSITFDYDYNLYVKLHLYNPDEESRQQLPRLHNKVVELQKELAALRQKLAER